MHSTPLRRPPLTTGFLSRRVFDTDDAYADADFVLLTCYGIDCIAPNPWLCRGLTEFDARREVAVRASSVSVNARDGLLITGAATLFSSDDFYEERPGWEAWM